MEQWKQKITDEIRRCEQAKNTLPLIEEQLKMVNYELEQVTDGSLRDRLLEKKEKLEKRIRLESWRIRLVELTLSGLPERENDILRQTCLAQYGDGTIDRLCEAYYLETASIYRIKDKAMKQYRALKSEEIG